MKESVTLWDMGIRGFHWSLVLSIGLLWLTGDVLDAFDWHEKVGLFVAGLLTFRVVWGVMGSSTARFNQFFPSKAKIADYLNGRWQGVGHNPLGAVSVFALLITLLLMVISGLFASNDGDYTGPLAFLVSTGVSEVLTNVHGALFNVLVLLVLVHVAAIVVYKLLFGDDLVKPMLTGQAEIEAEQATQLKSAPWWAWLVAAGTIVLMVWLASGEWHQPAAVTVSQPDW